VAFEIQELTKTIKKNPVPWAIGAGVAVIAGLVYFRGKESGYIVEAYPEQPLLPEDIAAGPGSPGDVTDAQLQELLAELERMRHEDLAQFGEMNAALMESLTRTLESYVNQTYYQQPQQPVIEPLPQQPQPVIEPLPQQPQPQVSPELLQKAEYIYQTPTIYFQPSGASYTPQQVEVMYNWALEENAALSRGYAGTSKNPVGLAESGMTVTYYPTGHVEFRPRGSSGRSSSSRSSSPSSYANPSLAEAARRESSGETRAAVSKVTGKSGSIESQLKGMSASQKLETLKKAGLIK
jgi:hypothetical protein